VCHEIDSTNDFFCFLPETDYGETCLPVAPITDPRGCPHVLNITSNVDTSCFLGSYVFFCDSAELAAVCQDAPPAGIGGDCINSVCIN
jgi:hypothetical protein